eukprot:gene2538-2779_t
MELFTSSSKLFNSLQLWPSESLLSNESSSKIEIYSHSSHQKEKSRLHTLVEGIVEEVGYRPSPYCLLDRRGQLQTATQYFLRNLTRLVSHVVKHPRIHVTFDREIIVLPDEGTIAIDWASMASDLDMDDRDDIPALHANSPIIMMFHGLVGDSQSEYLFHLTRKLLRRGYRVGVMIARGCGGLQLTSPHTFTGRRTADIRYCIERIRKHFPSAPLLWMGFSLGAAASLQYLEDYNGVDSPPSEITAAMVVCPPWSLRRQKVAGFDFWSALMTLPIKAYVLQHRDMLRVHHEEKRVNLSPMSILALKDIADFDQAFFPIYGGGYHSCLESGDSSSKPSESSSRSSQSTTTTTTTLSSSRCSPEMEIRTNKRSRQLAHQLELEEKGEEEGKTCSGLSEEDLQPYSTQDIASAALSRISHFLNEQYLSSSRLHHDKGQQHDNDDSDSDCSSVYSSCTSISATTSDGSSSGYDSDSDEEEEEEEEEQCQSFGGQTELPRVSSLQYNSLDEYYDDVSPVHRAHLIRTPTLSITAIDDPIVHHGDCPTNPKQLGPGLVVLKTPFGGHLAFPEGLAPVVDAWTDRMALTWFQRFLSDSDKPISSSSSSSSLFANSTSSDDLLR